MTIFLRRNDTIELNLVEYCGPVSLGELEQLAHHQAADRASAKSDALNIIAPGASFEGVDFAALDALYTHYRGVYQSIEFQILRRAAWVCRSEAARPHVEHWLEGRHPRDGTSSDVRMFEALGGACEWLMLNAREAAQVETGEGFREVVRFHGAPEPARAVAR